MLDLLSRVNFYLSQKFDLNETESLLTSGTLYDNCLNGMLLILLAKYCHVNYSSV